MKKHEKQDWIVQYVKMSKLKHVDIFDEEFVETYIDCCQPKKVIVQPYGAHTVPELGKYLSELYHSNVLNRVSIGLTQCYSGFPRWCYSYYLRN
uniref:hypothetical protein n=1 Tax=Clostridium sp. 12(A) TaxID=1163671 RepID=UPI0012DD5851|nr:hypothetical protein [Clostridium sp. 12(A)]